MNLKELLDGPAGELLLASDQLLVALVDREGRIVEWNGALARIWPIDAADRTLQSLLTAGSSRQIGDRLAEGPAAATRMTINVRQPGSDLPRTCTCSLLAAGEGRYLFFAEPQDELDRREAEEYVRLTNQLAARSRELEQLRHELAQQNSELETSLRALEEERARVKVLSGMLPICANCKKIRDDKGYWERIESYIDRHSEARFTHGICPDCIRELYPELSGGE